MHAQALTRLAALVAACAGLVGCSSGGGHTGATPTGHVSSSATTAASVSGETVFSQSCAACHSVSGHSSPRQQGGDLLHFRSSRTQLVQLTREMPVIHHRLTDREVAAVVDYLRRVQPRG
ncbi:MAG TPA: cytochrome c [Solirubrobacteraceae bacterium]|jgi:mono/diheme cytochrome c family protein|nr:cytochrome c [Solirubrobacteraceae bacterium]